MVRKKTHEEFVKEIGNKYRDECSIIGKYVNNCTKIKVRHNKCGYEYEVRPYSLLSGSGCPKCGREKTEKARRKTHEKFIKEVKEKYGNEYEILGEYVNNNTKILVRHNCGKCSYHEWRITPHNLLKGNRCPVCSNKKAVLGINTIWDTDRWMVDLGVSEEDAKRYSRGSGQEITVKCPDCGREKEMKIATIYYNKSIFCSCGDGKSYPEKFIFNLLEQLDLEFETEYKPKWIGNKRYDFHIKDISCIIETHGMQHYNGSFEVRGGRTLEEEQTNDKYKKEIALQNGIKHYMELDCRKSEMDYIKNSILNSELANLFDLSKIDWLQCAEFSNKNIVKEVCNYWNNKKEDETTIDIGKVFKTSRTSVIKYLKKGTKLGWCNYDSKEEGLKGSNKGGTSLKKILSKKVEIFKDNKSLGVFESCRELTRQSEDLFGLKLGNSMISSVCRGNRKTHKGFTFKYIENVA